MTRPPMTIKGSYEIPPIEGATPLRKGLMTGEFSEVVSVPTDVEGDKAEDSTQMPLCGAGISP